ncbi:hypothetical protein ACFVVA_37065 [Kitasatospora sp. NPDC058048]|uniref:hypothetical protein n=1 Tax=Kitasatospora sp. NPDC058048 TaxID=3346313 RepID=UPI0036D80D4F
MTDPFGRLRPLIDPDGHMPGDEFTARVLAVLTGTAVTGVLLWRWGLDDPTAVPVIGDGLARTGPVLGRLLFIQLAAGLGWWTRATVLFGTDLARSLDPRARWRLPEGHDHG